MEVQSETLRAALANRYRIERQLGEGGMATVYLAHDLKHHRKVALKVLKPEIGQTLGADRFHREIQLAARLSHPHILPLFDSGEAGGMLFYVMPSVEGRSPRDRLNESRQLPVAEAVRSSPGHRDSRPAVRHLLTRMARHRGVALHAGASRHAEGDPVAGSHE